MSFVEGLLAGASSSPATFGLNIYSDNRPVPSSIRASPSCIDLSGRYDHDRVRDASIPRSERPITEDYNPEWYRPDRHIIYRAEREGIFGPPAKRPRTGATLSGREARIHLASEPARIPDSSILEMFEPGWKIGAFFRCIQRPGFHNRIYDGPPDGTVRTRIGPDEIEINFSRPYKIRALFCNSTYSAVQFKTPPVARDDGSIQSGRLVWTNVRRHNAWWATLIDASVLARVPADLSETRAQPAVLDHDTALIETEVD
jgi:hypothetical protein